MRRYLRRLARAPALRRLSTSSEMRAQRLEHAGPVQRVGGELGHAAEVERVRQLGDVEDQLARQILLVVLHDERHGARVDALLGEVGVQVLEALDVLVELARLAVGDEHDAVGALEHELARRLVVDLPRHGVELELAS